MAKGFVLMFYLGALIAMLGVGHLIAGGSHVAVGAWALTWSIPFFGVALVIEIYHKFIVPLPSWGR